MTSSSQLSSSSKKIPYRQVSRSWVKRRGKKGSNRGSQENATSKYYIYEKSINRVCQENKAGYKNQYQTCGNCLDFSPSAIATLLDLVDSSVTCEEAIELICTNTNANINTNTHLPISQNSYIAMLCYHAPLTYRQSWLQPHQCSLQKCRWDCLGGKLLVFWYCLIIWITHINWPPPLTLIIASFVL